MALEKENGRISWVRGLNDRSESSPVAVYDRDGNGWIIQCAQDGNIYLAEGLTGAATGSMKLEAEIIASPAVYNDTMVIGTTGKGTSFIYGIEIRTLASAEGGEPEAVEAEPEEATKEMQEEPADEAEPEPEAEEPAEDEWNEEEGEEADE